MNAKETLKKLAETLGVIGEETVETPVEETTEEVVEEVAEAKAEETVEETAPETEEVKEEVEEPAQEEAPEVEEKQEEEKVDPRIAEMEEQINSLKDLLKKALESEEEEVKAPEIPAQEPKGLTHSPEAEVRPRANGIQNKGETIQSRVWKYINNS